MLFKEYAQLSGRRYDFLECYRMRDAEVERRWSRLKAMHEHPLL